MAFATKYQSEFYNKFQKLVQVQIAEDEFAGSITNIRTNSVEITFNWQGHDTPVAGTGAKIVVVNTGTFTSLDDLLTSLEKQFLCTIIYDGVTVFKGYSICDLNEQQFISNAKITLQFTDYLGRIDQYYPLIINDIASRSSIFDILYDVLREIDLHGNLYVNSSLFEENMNATDSDTFLEQTYIENNVFYADSVNYEDALEVINKALKPAEAYIYSAGDKWIIERWEDITRVSAWVIFQESLLGLPFASQATTPSLKETHNKQGDSTGATDDVFEYAETTQKVLYNSGLQKLILKLNDKPFDSVVFNDYDIAKLVSTNDEWPDPGALDLRKWYYYELLTGFERGYNFRGMSSYLKYYNPTTSVTTGERYGIYYAFEVQFAVSEEEPVILNISYTNSLEATLTNVDAVYLKFSIRVDGGTMTGKFLCDDELTDDSVIPSIDETYVREFRSSNEITTVSSKVWSHSKSINLTDRWLNSYTNVVHDSIWGKLGSPLKQKFIIMFWPPELMREGANNNFLSHVNYLGDISISVTQGDITNKLTYYVNQSFIKTEEQDMHLFDLDNTNFVNGLMYRIEDSSAGEEAQYAKTAAWTSVNNVSAVELMDIYAMTKFRYNFRTMYQLQSTILYDGYLKPFTILTDDNLQDDSNVNRQFILTNYTWDLVNGTYDINAEEAPDEDITLAGYTTGLATPTGLAVEEDSGDGTIDISWDAVTGATGYQVQRKPSWIPFIMGLGVWAQSWVTVYSSSGTSFTDTITDDGTPTQGMSVCYRVRAYNTTENTAYSSEVCISYDVI